MCCSKQFHSKQNDRSTEQKVPHNALFIHRKLWKTKVIHGESVTPQYCGKSMGYRVIHGESVTPRTVNR